MSKNHRTTVSLGLDVGTSRVVLARPDGERFQFTDELNAFVSMPHARMTESALRRENVPFAVQDNQIFVHGNQAPRFASLLNIDTRRPMAQGVINSAEPESVTMVRRIIESVVGDLAGSKPRILFSVPAAPAGAEDSLTYHEATLRQICGAIGGDVRPINEGLAVVYSELEDTNYSGIGVSFGGGLCNVSMAWLSMPVMSFSIPKAGDFIDSSAASVTGDLATRVRLCKEESFHFNGHFTDKLHQVLSIYYEDMMASLISAMSEAFASSRMPRNSKPVPIVLSGGSATPPGFRDRFESLLKQTAFPIEISEVRMARAPLTTTARGALVASLAEE